MSSEPRVPPHDTEAEEAVLGAFMLSEKSQHLVDELRRDDFYAEKHRLVFDAVNSLYQRGEPIDAITVFDALRKMGVEDQVTAPYLHTLVSTVTAASNAQHYKNIVVEKSQLRQSIETFSEYSSRAYSEEESALDVVSGAEGALAAIANRQARGRLALPDYAGALRALDEDLGVPTGFERLDKLLGGVKGGQLVLVAGRPGSGKTSLCLQIAQNVALDEGAPVAVFSMEMSSTELTHRLICQRGKIDGSRLREGWVSNTERGRIEEIVGDLAGAPIYIDDQAVQTVGQIRSRARAIARERGLGLIVVDYLQLMGQGAENRVREVSEISRTLKILAKDLDVPVIAASQLNRAAEAREDGEPRLADLRESGGLEQDADAVLLVWPVYQYDEETDNGRTIVRVAKNRSGATGDVRFDFASAWTRFREV